VAAEAAGAAAAGAVAAAAEAAAVVAAAGTAVVAINGVAAEIGGEPAPNPVAAAAAAAAAVGGRRPAPISAFDVLVPGFRALGRTAAHDVVSFCIAVATDPVVFALNLDHVAGLRGLADLLRSATMEADFPVVLMEAVKVGPISDLFLEHLSTELLQLLRMLRMGVAFLTSLRRMENLRATFAASTAACVDKMVDFLIFYHAECPLAPDSAAVFRSRWCPAGAKREGLRAQVCLPFPTRAITPPDGDVVPRAAVVSRVGLRADGKGRAGSVLQELSRCAQAALAGRLHHLLRVQLFEGAWLCRTGQARASPGVA